MAENPDCSGCRPGSVTQGPLCDIGRASARQVPLLCLSVTPCEKAIAAAHAAFDVTEPLQSDVYLGTGCWAKGWVLSVSASPH